MRHLETIEIKGLGWGDASFRGFTWENDGRDLRLFIEHASFPVSALLCHWTSDLRIDLSWRRSAISKDRPIRFGGPLLTCDTSIEYNADGRWVVVMDFAHDGQLMFECERITAGYEEAPSSTLQSGNGGES